MREPGGGCNPATATIAGGSALWLRFRRNYASLLSSRIGNITAGLPYAIWKV
ncbi:MAG: hypothetical protein QOG17_305, partial [Gammaproteobacteria bacterium]|nr:hypothetical protein [Gammaproteobacteria bacterium]